MQIQLFLSLSLYIPQPFSIPNARFILSIEIHSFNVVPIILYTRNLLTNFFPFKNFICELLNVFVFSNLLPIIGLQPYTERFKIIYFNLEKVWILSFDWIHWKLVNQWNAIIHTLRDWNTIISIFWVLKIGVRFLTVQWAKKENSIISFLLTILIYSCQ